MTYFKYKILEREKEHYTDEGGNTNSIYYKTVPITQSELNELGKYGWEVVSCVWEEFDIATVLLKRGFDSYSNFCQSED